MKPMINIFTGELDMDTRPEVEIQREKGREQKKLHEAEMEEYGEPHPYTGKRMERPKSTGMTYDIPPIDGTYSPNQVDKTGADATDINKIMDRIDPAGKQFSNAIAQGLVTDAGMRYDDFTAAPDFQAAQNTFIHATQQFQRLPANLRSRFDHDPVKFLDYMHDEKNMEEQYQLGIRVKKPVEEKDATNKDVIKAIQESSKTKKNTPKE